MYCLSADNPLQWYMGDNIPGKPRECLIYLGGVPNYYGTLQKCANEGFAGFTQS